MPDPALLALVQHFANPPPAIVQPAPMAEGDILLSAYEAIATQQERDFEGWLVRLVEMRRGARVAFEADPHAFTSELFDDIIGPFERHMRRQKRVTARLERRTPRHLSDRLKRLRERTLARQRRQYEAADGLVRFLREMRNEAAEIHQADAPSTAWVPNETTVAAMERARAGKLEVVTLDDLRAAILADD